MRFATTLVVLVSAAHLTAVPVRFDIIPEKSIIAVRTDKAGILSVFGAGHRHGIIASDFTARVCADPNAFEDGTVSVRVPVSSLRIDTSEARRSAGLSPSGPAAKDIPVIQEKMLSADNLAASQHPDIHFVSSSVRHAPGGLNVHGSLTIRGRARPISVLLRIQQARSDYRFIGQFDIKLTDYGITPESVGGVIKVGDEVTVLLDLLARLGKEPCR